MSEKSKWWIALVSPFVAVLMFVVGSLILVPARAQAEQIADHERRLTIEEVHSEGLKESFEDFKRQYEKDSVDEMRLLNRLLDMLMGK